MLYPHQGGDLKPKELGFSKVQLWVLWEHVVLSHNSPFIEEQKYFENCALLKPEPVTLVSVKKIEKSLVLADGSYGSHTTLL